MECNGKFARMFYVSAEWKACRLAKLTKTPLCERCGKPAEHVHHKIRLTPQNIRDPSISLNPDNLESLCEACHIKEHKPMRRWRCDANGHVELDTPLGQDTL